MSTSDADSDRADNDSVNEVEEEDEDEEEVEVEEEVEEDEEEGDGDGEQEEVEEEEVVDEEEQEEEGGDLTDAVVLGDDDPEGYGEQDVEEEEGMNEEEREEGEEEEEREEERGVLSGAVVLMDQDLEGCGEHADVAEEGVDEEEKEEEEREEERGDLSDAMVLMDEGHEGYGDEEDVTDEEVVDEEDEEEEREEERGDLSDAMVLMDEDHRDNIKKPESGGHGKDLELVSSVSSGSGNNTASLSHCKDGGDGGLTNCDPPAKMLLAHKIEVSDNSEVAQLTVKDKHTSSEENAIPKSSLGGKEIKTLAEGQASIGDMKGAKSSNTQAHGDQQSHLLDNSIYDNNEFAERSMIGTTIGKSNGLLRQSQMKTELRMSQDLSLSSTSPQKRPRSSSPEITMDNLNKKPALLCSFFARGWCIKGNSCRFLHQKEGGRDLDQKEGSKENLTVPSKTIDILDGTGAKDTDRSNSSSSQELSDLPNTEGSSKSKIQIQRALVMSYGGKSDGSTQFNDDHTLRIEDESSNVDVHQGGRTFVREESKSPFGVGPHFDPMNDRQSASEHLLSRRYLTEGKLQWEVPKRETINDSSFARESSFTMNSLVAENRHYSGGPSSSSIYNNRITPSAYDKSLDDLAFRDRQSNLPFQGTYSNFNLTGASKTSFNSSLQTSLVSQSPYTVSQGAISSAYCSTRSVEALDIHKVLEVDRGYNDSRSASLPRSSSPYFSRPEAESTALHSISRDLPSVGIRILGNPWEPSVPFRPSFNHPLCLPSPGNQYDPLLDSIEPVNKGNIILQASSRVINQNVLSRAINDEPQLYGHHFPGEQRTLSSFPQPYEGTLRKSSPAHGPSGGTALVAALAPSSAEGKKSSMPKEEKGRFPDYLIDNTDVNDAEAGGDSPGKGIIVKESKATKFFRAALVEFVKELVKPSWREGHLSKDAHKKIVKKTVEKVLRAIQPHQIPSTTESINQYMSTSRRKILKLVEGYVDKYSKP